ncbi:putative MO25-like protein At5g47540 isoform X2 [Diospyros lotus]|uniref:putative MO25-like protein At5g47540 isoform X2 n=1 Tax=Diospyros lotus TaxID=55363 RepID=UPI0022578169|nr:putative MO25-like protein At5g47540 isoform X2 [Diospyros lotus]
MKRAGKESNHAFMCVALPKKGLFFKSKARRTPSELVGQVRHLLNYMLRNNEPREAKRKEKISELSKLFLEMRTLLYGDSESEPVPETCSQLTKVFFEGDILRLLINCLPKLDLEARQEATHVAVNLQRQQVNSRLIASDYMEQNADLVDVLVLGYGDPNIALSYGPLLRGCIRHQVVARHILESEHLKLFFDYIQSPNFELASDAAATFRELLTRHKSTVSEFLSRNYQWFFQEYNLKLLDSPNYITRRQAIKLLEDILVNPSNSSVMIHYVSSLDNLRILMNLLRDSNKAIQLNAFHVFKLFVANPHKPRDVAAILIANRSKLLQFLGSFNLDRATEEFEADKAQVVKEIAVLELKDTPFPALEKCGIAC